MVLEPGAADFRALDVVLDDDRIAALVEPGAGPSDGVAIDASGLFVLPGLIDCHVHLAMRGEDADPSASASRSDEEIAAQIGDAAERTVRGGVTTVRDLGGWNHLEMRVRDDVEAARRAGPRMVLAGRLLSAPTPAVSYYPGMYEVVGTTEDVRAAVRREIEAGAGVIKVMATGAMLSPEDEDAREAQLGEAEIAAAVDEAARAGVRVAAHAHAVEGVLAAVRAGVASVEHGTFADDDVLALMAERGTFLVATLSAGTASLDEQTRAAMPPHLLERFLGAQDTHVRTLRLAHRLGVPFAMGTDAGTPGNHHGANGGECALLVREAGLTAREAIDAATVDAARLLGRERELGALAAGHLADLIGMRRDPLEDVGALADVSLVVKGGRVVRPEHAR